MFLSTQAEPIRVLVTGAAGQIAYSLLYSIAKGDVFGKDQVRFILSFDYIMFRSSRVPFSQIPISDWDCYIMELPWAMNMPR